MQALLIGELYAVTAWTYTYSVHAFDSRVFVNC